MDVLGLLAAVAVVVVADCWFRPFRRCWWCSGRPRKASPVSQAYGKCRHCGGSGEKVRFGARILGRKR